MRIGIAQCNFTVGDLSGNTAKILEQIKKHGNDCDLLVFSELAITGYPPLDLVLSRGFVYEQLRCLGEITNATSHVSAAVVIGYVDVNDGAGKELYNSLAVCKSGEIVFRYQKRCVPTYNVFDESRYFEAGTQSGVWKYQGTRIGFLICEDAWNDNDFVDRNLYNVDPVKDCFEKGADIFVSINASPSELGKLSRKVGMFSKMAAKYNTPFVYVNQVGANDDLVFDGNSFAIDACGKVIRSMSCFAEDYATICFFHGYSGNFQDYSCPSEFFYRQIVFGIREYVTKCGFRDVVFGCSGGIDSALVGALAVDALGASHVKAITMPSKVSTEGSVTDSEKLCNALGIELLTHPIGDLVEQYRDAFKLNLDGGDLTGLSLENLQPRIRCNILMEYSNKLGHLLLSTGNKSEASVGYCTIYGDMGGGFSPISDLYKTEVWDLARYYNKFHGKEIIPLSIIDKAPSAELYEGQKDTDSLPPYPVLDAILRLYIEGDMLDCNERETNIRAVEEWYEESDDWPPILTGGVMNKRQQLAEKVLRLVDRAEFKRRQAPPTLRVHGRAWGAGRRYPIAQKCTQFSLEKLLQR